MEVVIPASFERQLLDGTQRKAYSYDPNGTTTDGLRGMSIAYNPLNLPQKVSKEADQLTYDAAGSKFSKRHNGNATQYYTGSIIYQGDGQLHPTPRRHGAQCKWQAGVPGQPEPTTRAACGRCWMKMIQYCKKPTTTRLDSTYFAINAKFYSSYKNVKKKIKTLTYQPQCTNNLKPC